MVHPLLSYGTVHPSFLKGFRCMATKPTLVLPWAIELLWSSVFSLSWTCTLGRPLGSRVRVSVCCAGGLREHRGDTEVLFHGEETLSQTLSVRVPLGWGTLLSLCGQGRSFFPQTTSLSHPQQPLAHHCFNCVWSSPLGESAPTYANVRLSFINIYAGKQTCSSVCTAGALLLRQSVVSSGESKNLC